MEGSTYLQFLPIEGELTFITFPPPCGGRIKVGVNIL